MSLSLSALLRKSWAIARAGARRFGGSVRSYLAAAMRQAWAEAKRVAADVAAMKVRVRNSLATLASDHAECERFMARWYAEQEAQGMRRASVLPFPARRPVPAAPALRAA